MSDSQSNPFDAADHQINSEETIEKKSENKNSISVPIDENLRYRIVNTECASITLSVIVLITRSVFSIYYVELHDISKATYSQPTNILLSILIFVTVSCKTFFIFLLVGYSRRLLFQKIIDCI